MIVLVRGCPACETVAGVRVTPGGVVYEDEAWLLLLRPRPLLTPGEGQLLLRRHCADLDSLTAAELAALGPLIRATTRAMTAVLRPASVDFGVCDGAPHVQLDVLPRVAGLPSGRLATAWLAARRALRPRPPADDEAVARLAEKLRLAWPRMPA